MAQRFKVLEVQGRKEWNGQHGPNVDWTLVIEHPDGVQQQVVTTRKPTSPAPIYGDIIEGDILPPKFDDSLPVLKRHFNPPPQGQAQQQQRWQPEGSTTNGAPATTTSGPQRVGDWTPDRAERYDHKQYVIARQAAQKNATWAIELTEQFKGADFNDARIRSAFLNLHSQLTDAFQTDATREVNAGQVKQTFPGTTETTQVPSHDVPVGL